MESLTSVLGSQPEEEGEHLFPDGGYHYCPKRYKLTAPASAAQLAQARTIMAAAFEPLSRAELARELSKLRLVSASNIRGQDLEGWMEVMAEELADFPAAVVIEACKRWRRREKFLPTCAQLVEECHTLNRRRRALRQLVEG